MKVHMALIALSLHRGVLGIRLNGGGPLFVGSLVDGTQAQLLGWTGKTRTLSERFFAMLSLLSLARYRPSRVATELLLEVDSDEGAVELADLRKLLPFTGTASVEIMRRDILNHFRVNNSGHGVFIRWQSGMRGCHDSDRLSLACAPTDIKLAEEAEGTLLTWLRERLVVVGTAAGIPFLEMPSLHASAHHDVVLSDNHNPFRPHRPVVHAPSFVGRFKEVGVLGQWLRTYPLQDIALLAPHVAGKTSLLQKLLHLNQPGTDPGPYATHWRLSEHSLRLLYVNFELPLMQREHGLLSFMASSLGLANGAGESLERFVAAATNSIKVPTVILLDHVNVALRMNPLGQDSGLRDNFWDAMRGLVADRTNGCLAFLLAVTEEPIVLAHRHHRSSPFFNMLRALEMKQLSESESRTLLAASPIRIEPADVDWILSQTECWPLLLQIAGARYIEAAQNTPQNSENGADWKRELMFEIARLKPSMKP